jgi:hypothetical protein
VKKLISLSIVAVSCLVWAAALQHRPTYPEIPKPMDTSVPRAAVPANVGPRVDLIQLQREADVLAKTAQSIPADVESIRKGILPKDVIQKLKEIEKLSKRLRSELNP